MIQNPAITGAVAGGIAGLFMVSAALVPPLALLLTFFAPLPLMIAGLSTGLTSAAVACVTGAMVSGFASGWSSAATFLVIGAIPAMVVTYLALSSREVTAPDGTSLIEWYPAGRLFAAIIFMGASLVTVVALQVSDESSDLARNLETTLTTALGGEKGIKEIVDGAGVDFSPRQYINLLMETVPVGIGLVFMAIVAVNAGVAQRMLVLRGRALRPSPSIRDMELPLAHDIAFVGAVLLNVFPGTLGVLGATLTAYFLVAYFLLGLVVVHVMSSRWPSRGLVLFAFYLCLLVLPGPIFLVAILGLADAAFGLRQRPVSTST